METIAGGLVLGPVPGEQFGAVRTAGQGPAGGAVAAATLTQGQHKTVLGLAGRQTLGEVSLDRAIQSQIGLRKDACGSLVNLPLQADQGVEARRGHGHAMTGHLHFEGAEPGGVLPALVEQALPSRPTFLIGAGRVGMSRIGGMNQAIEEFQAIGPWTGEEAVLGGCQPDHRQETR